MPNGVPHPAELKAEAVRLHLEGHSNAEIGRRLDVHPRRVTDWVRNHVTGRGDTWERREMYRRTREELSELVYETVVETLRSLRARAIATADPDWTRGQNASDLAQLDSAQWNFLVRFVASFRPVEDAPGDDGSGEVIDVEPAADRNGAVGPTD